MINSAELMLMKPNTVAVKSIRKISTSPTEFVKCASLIKNGEYSAAYDFDGDGYLTWDDYDIMYNRVYRLYDEWQSGSRGNGSLDIRMMIHVKKIVAGDLPFDADYDLDGDGVVTSIDTSIARFWLLMGKVAKEEHE